MAWSSFLVENSSREHQFVQRDLLPVAVQYVAESAIMIPYLFQNGALRIVVRELRFLVELSLKVHLACAGIGEVGGRSLVERIAYVRESLDRSRFSRKLRGVKLPLLGEQAEQFIAYAKSFYDDASGYVHLSSQLLDDAVPTLNLGKESDDQSGVAVAYVNRGLSVSLVLLCHSVVESVVGDYCVESDGGTVSNYFTRSRFLAKVDGYYDYKAERASVLERIQRLRAAAIEF